MLVLPFSRKPRIQATHPPTTETNNPLCRGTGCQRQTQVLANATKNLEKQPTHKHCEKNKSIESLIWRSKKDSERQNILSDLASDVVVRVMFSV